MKIKLISDVHQEFYEDKELYKNPTNADVLIIAGDLAVGHEAVISALKQFGKNYANVVYVPGNHEYYGGEIALFDQYVTRFTEGTNIHFLNPYSVKIGDVTFIGAALWTNFRDNMFSKIACRNEINDFRTIWKFTPQVCSELHYRHKKYIMDRYAAAEGKTVIVTHFMPAIECIAPEYYGDSAINDYFANDMGAWIGCLSDATWMYGHTHTPGDMFLGDTRVVCNPYGYNRNFDYKECLIDL
ncbi:MAG: metallophosphoesterase [Methylococcales bacterium]